MNAGYLQEDDENGSDLDPGEEVALRGAGVDERFVLVPDQQAVHRLPHKDPHDVGDQTEGREPVEKHLEVLG